MPVSEEVLFKTLEKISAIELKQLLRLLDTTPVGLSDPEARSRLEKYGLNVTAEEKKFKVIGLLLSRFKSPLIAILFVVAVVSFLTGQKLDSVIVLSMILMSVVLNFIQEYKANKAATKLKERISTKVAVVRNGYKRQIESSKICVGDVVEFSAGDLIVADARLLKSKDLYLNQASLTGESFPIEKKAESSDMGCIILGGTTVVTGSCNAVVVKTGNKTELGKVAQKLSIQEEENQFTKGINSFSSMILKVIIFFVLFIFLVNSFIKQDLLQSLTFSVAVAVGLTPEFLPMIMSVTMGLGSVHMAKKGVLVKKLTAIPTFGSLDVLCTDKTGTLTQDKIQLVKYVNPFGEASESVFKMAYLNSYYQTGIINPMDGAVLKYKHIDTSLYKKIDEVPFDFLRKKMSVVVEKDNKLLLITKGAPEEVFKSCNSYESKEGKVVLEDSGADTFVKEYYDLSAEAFRVLAVAVKDVTSMQGHVFTKEDEKDMTLCGFAAFLDPAKEGAKEAIDSLEHLGIEIKVLTGDNVLVAKKICADVDIITKGVLLGEEIAKMTDHDLQKIVNEVSIFARVNPIDKNRIILALKANGHVVGYLGDGINDALSLKTADVGISVENAVDVAKESADIILTSKSLKQLGEGVLEGRKIYGNTMKYIMMSLSSNFGNMFSVLGAVLFLPFLPMLPIQILLTNFIYDVSQLSIPTDNVDPSFLEKPKKWSIDNIKKFMLVFGPISSLFDYLTFVTLYFGYRLVGPQFQTGWFLESLATQTLVIFVMRTKQIPFFKSKPSKLLILSTLVCVGFAWVLPFTLIGKVFGLVPLPYFIYGILAGYVVLYVVFVEAGKKFFYRTVNNW